MDEFRPSIRHGRHATPDVLRTFLRRDYLTTSDFSGAVRDLAQMAREAVTGTDAVVALWSPAEDEWVAYASDGSGIRGDELSRHTSRAILEEVRRTERPLIAFDGEPLALSSGSIVDLGIRSVLAAPIFRWELQPPSRERAFWGCVCAYRDGGGGPFSAEDSELLTDLTELAQRTLNLVRALGQTARDLEAARQEVQALRTSRAATRQGRLGSFETRDSAFAENVIERLRRILHADRLRILLTGPTGAGKSSLAQAFHYESRRKDGPFVTLDCSQITSAETLGAELFGYAPQSGFAAPREGRVGKARLADRGTLFVDEVSTLPGELQTRLLRLLETGRFAPLGSSDDVAVDVQIIAATSADLAGLVRAGRFREDLFWRLCEVALELPALTQRPADIEPLAWSFLARACERFGRPELIGISSAALTSLCRHDWARAGNIRGLQHVINRSVLFSPTGLRQLCPEHLVFDTVFDAPGRVPEAAAPAPLAGAVPAADAEVVVAAPPAAAKVPLPAGPRSAAAWLAETLRGKIFEHGGQVTAMARDSALTAALGYGQRALPPSSLAVHLKRLGLEPLLAVARARRREAPSIADITAAIRLHGSGAAAARVLGLSRDSLGWRLRQAGLTVRGILGAR
ncbi:MAG: sigma 54-interacting transcriptional regulator [Candidatus Schekmanbacteria bacterium]|nr:sigma 54-interacting transcriptional regulator [Candidatus Schekmanbacteria bacterium]